ncbi:hypothetical protein [Kribbella catacumbae]|uniref:hypothetical protein n=1 Tax=Kribbella catacumbae TaxID=460086 RepID=UPI00036124E9|nr:hypothetical protein [Kribbella catacumbae]
MVRIARRTAVLLGALGLTAALLPVQSVVAASAVTCGIRPGAVTAGGDHREITINATSPVSASFGRTFSNIYPDGQVKLSTSIELSPDTGASGWVVMGSSLYGSGYEINGDQAVNPQLVKVGGGWNDFTFIDTSYYTPPSGTGPNFRANQYGLRADGVLFRWSPRGGNWWTNRDSYPGFASVKTMALISRTFTYDTFLANTRGGALYTIRIPSSSPMKPIVKRVRTSTWQSFDWLLAQGCGSQSTLLLGIDKETKSGYLYAVSHATGPTTTIKGLGKAPIAFTDPVYFRRKIESDPLFGE